MLPGRFNDQQPWSMPCSGSDPLRERVLAAGSGAAVWAAAPGVPRAQVEPGGRCSGERATCTLLSRGGQMRAQAVPCAQLPAEWGLSHSWMGCAAASTAPSACTSAAGGGRHLHAADPGAQQAQPLAAGTSRVDRPGPPAPLSASNSVLTARPARILHAGCRLLCGCQWLCVAG